jgi:hypothetical protein
MRNKSTLSKVAIDILLVLGFLMSGSIPGFSRGQVLSLPSHRERNG